MELSHKKEKDSNEIKLRFDIEVKSRRESKCCVLSKRGQAAAVSVKRRQAVGDGHVITCGRLPHCTGNFWANAITTDHHWSRHRHPIPPGLVLSPATLPSLTSCNVGDAPQLLLSRVNAPTNPQPSRRRSSHAID